jgi:hypothetical protein
VAVASIAPRPIIRPLRRRSPKRAVMPASGGRRAGRASRGSRGR